MPIGIKVGALTTAVWQQNIPADIRANGAVSITPEIQAVARNTSLRADAALSRPVLMQATAKNASLHANAAVTKPVTASAVASNHTEVANGAVSITIQISATTSAKVASIGLMTIPSLTMAGVLETGTTGEMVIPALTASGNMSFDNQVAGAMYMPAMQAYATGNNDALMTMPALQVYAEAISEALISGTMRVPSLRASGEFDNARQMVGYMSIPALKIRALSLVGGQISGIAELPKLRANGQLQAGLLIAGVMELPALTMTGRMTSEAIAELVEALPALIVIGTAQNATIVEFTGWVTNTENLLTSNYDNYNYLLVANAFGRNMAVAEDGIYELTGDDDAGLPIVASVLFGLDSFRTEDLKRVKAVHLGYRADNAGALEVQIIVDGEAPVRRYPVKHVSSAGGVKRGRATIAKGLKSRYWQYGVNNVDGADFTIDDMNIYVQQHNRKAQ